MEHNHQPCYLFLNEQQKYKIIDKVQVTPHIKKFDVEAPAIASRGKPGQFVILRIDDKSERIPITLGDVDAFSGTIRLYVAEVGATTKELGDLRIGDNILNVSGPLGNPTEVEKLGQILCVANRAFIGAHLFLAKALKEAGNKVVSVTCGRVTDDFYLKQEIRNVCDEAFTVLEDSETQGISDFLKKLLDENKFEHVHTIGSVSMQKQVSQLTKSHSIKTTASLFPVMVDGTGMCGACRVTIEGSTRFACIHGPDFDAHKVDFDELITRMRFYTPHEKIAMVLQDKNVI